MWFDRQSLHYSFTLTTVSKEYIQMLRRPYRNYILMETLTSPLATEGPEGVVLARCIYLVKRWNHWMKWYCISAVRHHYCRI
jgi:hypothetical protein